MSHPLMDIVAAAAVVIAVGAGTALVLPRAKPPEPPAQTIVLDIETPPAVRVEPLLVKSDAERVDDLQRRLSEIAAEQRRLAIDLRAAVEARWERKDRGRKTR
jgi:hypothetical protein